MHPSHKMQLCVLPKFNCALRAKAGLGAPLLVLGGAVPAKELMSFIEVSCVEAAAAWKEMAVAPVEGQVVFDRMSVFYFTLRGV